MPSIQMSDGVRLFVQDWGAGEPIVFIHGWLFSHRIFEYSMRSLADAYRVVGIDVRGFGESDQPWEGNDDDTWGRDVVQVIQALDLRNVMLVGYAMGGAIAAHCAATQREPSITKLVLLSAAVPALAPDLTRQKLFRKSIRTLLADPAKSVHDFIVAGFHTAVSVQYVRWLEEIAMRASLHAQVRGLEEMLAQDLSAEIGRIGTPTRIFHGVHDQVIPFVAAEAQQRMLRGAERVRFEKSNHAIFWDEKEKLTEEPARFAFEKVVKVT
ncbi:MAG: alpha/beta hydrolase [Nitrospirae bacterium]|nr:alpha/beta hydrolase [Candidatus Manganitrophaceae bacterium]